MNMTRFSFRGSFAALGFCIFLSGAAFAADTVWWNGSVNTDLATGANWDGGVVPTLSTQNAGFKNVPSADYTLTLTNDLVFAGSWYFDDDKRSRRTFDLGGHTLTFKTAYVDSNNGNLTNIVKNGTIAFKDANGSQLECRFWSGANGCHFGIGAGGTLDAYLKFADGGRRSLLIERGGLLRGYLSVTGTDTTVDVRGKGSTVDAGGAYIRGASSSVSFGGTRTRVNVSDGAAISNLYVFTLSGKESKVCVSNATFRMLKARDYFNYAYVTGVSNRIDVVDGGEFVWGGGCSSSSTIGNSNNDRYNELRVAGEGSVVSNLYAYNSDNPLIAGQQGCYNRIHVTDGAFLYSQSISAGGQRKNIGDSCVTSVCNRITVDNGATLRCQPLYVATRHGDDAAKAKYLTSYICSNLVEVLEGGTIKSSSVTCGLMKPSFGNGVVVRGRDAVLESGNVKIGEGGSYGNYLEVVDGGQLKMTGDLNIGYGGSNNWARLEGCAFTNDSYTIYLGTASYPNNRLWLGTGSALSYSVLYAGGADPEVVVSNATLRLKNLNMAHFSATRPKFSFYGPTAKILTTGGSTYNFTNNTVFAFHVPQGGYLSAPFESSNSTIYLRDDPTSRWISLPCVSAA